MEESKQIFHSLADNLIIVLPNWPFLSLVHFFVTSALLRCEPGSREYAIKHPIASCSITIVVAISGGLIANLILGKPLLDSLLNETAIWCGVLIWYLVYFSPNDVVFKIYKLRIVKNVLSLLEEVRRSRKVMEGVIYAAVLYPNSLLLLALTGMFNGTGKKWSITLYRLITGSDLVGRHELLSLSYTTKAGFLLGVFFATCHTHQISYLTNNECILLGGVFLLSCQLYNMWYQKTSDPLQSLQLVLWSILTKWSTIDVSSENIKTDQKKNQ